MLSKEAKQASKKDSAGEEQTCACAVRHVRLVCAMSVQPAQAGRTGSSVRHAWLVCAMSVQPAQAGRTGAHTEHAQIWRATMFALLSCSPPAKTAMRVDHDPFAAHCEYEVDLLVSLRLC